MSWTQGQQNRTNQSPFIDPTTDERPHSKPNSSYNRSGAPRTDYNNQRTPNPTPRVSTQRDVAATFTQEGLQTFSTIFSSAVEAAIAKGLPDLIERAVERKVEQLLVQTRTELEGLVESITNQIVDIVVSKLPQPLSHGSNDVTASPTQEAVEETAQLTVQPTSYPSNSEDATEANLSVPPRPSEPIAIESPTTTPKQRAADNRLGKDEDPELLLVLRALKQSDGPVKMDELKDELPDVQWGKNASVKMSNFMHKSNGQIERVSRGLYQYREVN